MAQRSDVSAGLGLKRKTDNEIVTESRRQVALISIQCCNQQGESVTENGEEMVRVT